MIETVFFVGLDGVTWDLVRPWIEVGELPALASFIYDGAHGMLHSTVPPNTPVAIPALYTGWHAYNRDGIWMSKGPNLASGATFNANISDVATTI